MDAIRVIEVKENVFASNIRKRGEYCGWLFKFETRQKRSRIAC
jgi:hypothetical protein